MFNKNRNIVLYSKNSNFLAKLDSQACLCNLPNKKSATKLYFGASSCKTFIFSNKPFFFFSNKKNSIKKLGFKPFSFKNESISFCFSKNNQKTVISTLVDNFNSPLHVNRENKNLDREFLYLSRKDPFFYEKRAMIISLVQSFFLEDGYQINFGGFPFLQQNFAFHLEKKKFSQFENSLSQYGSFQKPVPSPEIFLSQSIFGFFIKTVFYRKFCYFLSFHFLTNNPIVSSLDLIFFRKSLKFNIVDKKENLFIFSKSLPILHLVNQPFFLRFEETKNLVNKSGYQFSNKTINLYSPLPVMSVDFSKVSKNFYFAKSTPSFLDLVKTSSEIEFKPRKDEQKRREETYLFLSGDDLQIIKKRDEIGFISPEEKIFVRKSKPINFYGFPLKTEKVTNQRGVNQKNNKFSYFQIKNFKINELGNKSLVGNHLDKKKFLKKVDLLPEQEIFNLQIFPKFYKTKTGGFVFLKNPLFPVLTINNFSYSGLKDGSFFPEFEEEGYMNSSFSSSSDSFIETHLEQIQIFFIPEEVYECTQFSLLAKLRNLDQGTQFFNKNNVFSKIEVNSSQKKKKISQNIITKIKPTFTTSTQSTLLKPILNSKWNTKQKPLFYRSNRQGKKFFFYSPFDGLVKIYLKKNQSLFISSSKEKRLQYFNSEFVPFSYFCFSKTGGKGGASKVANLATSLSSTKKTEGTRKRNGLYIKNDFSKSKILTTLKFFQFVGGDLESSNWFLSQNIGFSSFLEQKKYQSNFSIKPFIKEKILDKPGFKSTLDQKKVLIPKKMEYIISFTSKKYNNKFSIPSVFFTENKEVARFATLLAPPFSSIRNFFEDFNVLDQNKKTFGEKKHVLSQKFRWLVKNYQKNSSGLL